MRPAAGRSSQSDRGTSRPKGSATHGRRIDEDIRCVFMDGWNVRESRTGPRLPFEPQRHAASGTVQTIVEHIGKRRQAVTGAPVHRHVIGDSREEIRLRFEDEEVVARADPKGGRRRPRTGCPQSPVRCSHRPAGRTRRQDPSLCNQLPRRRGCVRVRR